MKIFTVRHGETDWNAQRRLQGHSDIPLNEMGLQQAENLGLRLAKEKIDIIYSSDLLRAANTARAIASHHNAEVVTSSRLREKSFGIYEGRLIDEVYEDIDWDFPDGGEHVDAAFARIQGYLDEITASGYENIAIVGHYGSVTACICYFLKLPTCERMKFEVGNTAIHSFELDANGKWSMTLENDISHL